MSARKPRVLNPPKRIFLNVGEPEEDVEFDALHRGYEDSLTWCETPLDDSDIEYRLVKPSKHRPRKVKP
jgi:hypothetical protein